MTKQKKLDSVYLNIANEISTLSHCQRTKVGSVIVSMGNIIAFGYNGTPSGMDNACECDGVTKPEVIHAEMNAILKAAKGEEFINQSPGHLGARTVEALDIAYRSAASGKLEHR
jgi:deoxycytidylate deaminase